MNNYLKQNAVALANTIYSICIWNKKNTRQASVSKNLIKVPPIFLYPEDGKRTLVALIHTIDDYNNKSLTLKELPSHFNKYCGKTIIGNNDLRKIHNWIQQINFGLRAATILYEINKNPNSTKLAIASSVHKNLCWEDGFSYVIREENEYKPLKYASRPVILKWLEEEVNQITNNQVFGAQPSDEEKELYGVRKHNDNIYGEAEENVHQLLKEAKAKDVQGDYTMADTYDCFLKNLYDNIRGVSNE